ncbi:uncharacterized protein SCODWIG_01981 [Saccharomycodes ludwigii]|uniref:Uncharacterized protein n=1 Tax=Saccharomycodes ludwigii TaxID=36035 RepID=A0A376B7X5_9ASCO|nr:uncharacterized protein SCODWIG_01981 [Saccharomycodes ludwigii]
MSSKLNGIPNVLVTNSGTENRSIIAKYGNKGRPRRFSLLYSSSSSSDISSASSDESAEDSELSDVSSEDRVVSLSNKKRNNNDNNQNNKNKNKIDQPKPTISNNNIDSFKRKLIQSSLNTNTLGKNSKLIQGYHGKYENAIDSSSSDDCGNGATSYDTEQDYEKGSLYSSSDDENVDFVKLSLQRKKKALESLKNKNNNNNNISLQQSRNYNDKNKEDIEELEEDLGEEINPGIGGKSTASKSSASRQHTSDKSTIDKLNVPKFEDDSSDEKSADDYSNIYGTNEPHNYSGEHKEEENLPSTDSFSYDDENEDDEIDSEAYYKTIGEESSVESEKAGLETGEETDKNILEEEEANILNELESGLSFNGSEELDENEAKELGFSDDLYGTVNGNYEDGYIDGNEEDEYDDDDDDDGGGGGGGGSDDYYLGEFEEPLYTGPKLSSLDYYKDNNDEPLTLSTSLPLVLNEAKKKKILRKEMKKQKKEELIKRRKKLKAIVKEKRERVNIPDFRNQSSINDEAYDEVFYQKLFDDHPATTIDIKTNCMQNRTNIPSIQNNNGVPSSVAGIATVLSRKDDVIRLDDTPASALVNRRDSTTLLSNLVRRNSRVLPSHYHGNNVLLDNMNNYSSDEYEDLLLEVALLPSDNESDDEHDGNCENDHGYNNCNKNISCTRNAKGQYIPNSRTNSELKNTTTSNSTSKSIDGTISGDLNVTNLKETTDTAANSKNNGLDTVNDIIDSNTNNNYGSTGNDKKNKTAKEQSTSSNTIGATNGKAYGSEDYDSDDDDDDDDEDLSLSHIFIDIDDLDPDAAYFQEDYSSGSSLSSSDDNIGSSMDTNNNSKEKMDNEVIYYIDEDSTDEDDSLPPQSSKIIGTRAKEVVSASTVGLKPPRLGTWKTDDSKPFSIIDGLSTKSLYPSVQLQPSPAKSSLMNTPYTDGNKSDVTGNNSGNDHVINEKDDGSTMKLDDLLNMDEDSDEDDIENKIALKVLYNSQNKPNVPLSAFRNKGVDYDNMLLLNDGLEDSYAGNSIIQKVPIGYVGSKKTRKKLDKLKEIQKRKRLKLKKLKKKQRIWRLQREKERLQREDELLCELENKIRGQQQEGEGNDENIGQKNENTADSATIGTDLRGEEGIVEEGDKKKDDSKDNELQDGYYEEDDNELDLAELLGDKNGSPDLIIELAPDTILIDDNTGDVILTDNYLDEVIGNHIIGGNKDSIGGIDKTGGNGEEDNGNDEDLLTSLTAPVSLDDNNIHSLSALKRRRQSMVEANSENLRFTKAGLFSESALADLEDIIMGSKNNIDSGNNDEEFHDLLQ